MPVDRTDPRELKPGDRVTHNAHFAFSPVTQTVRELDNRGVYFDLEVTPYKYGFLTGRIIEVQRRKAGCP